MGTKMVYYRLQSDKPLPVIREALRNSLVFLGGNVMDMGTGFQVINGVNGVNFGFTAKLNAMVDIRETQPGQFDLVANINWSPAPLVWICLAVGIFVLGILWVIPLLYLFLDPGQAYQQALYNTQNFIR